MEKLKLHPESDLTTLREEYEKHPGETHIIKTNKENILITLDRNLIVDDVAFGTKNTNHTKIIAWTEEKDVNLRKYAFSKILNLKGLRYPIIKVPYSKNLLGKECLPIATTFESNLYRGNTIIKNEHLALETHIDFRRMGIMKLLLKIREEIVGIFKDNFSVDASNTVFLMQNGYKITEKIDLFSQEVEKIDDDEQRINLRKELLLIIIKYKDFYESALKESSDMALLGKIEQFFVEEKIYKSFKEDTTLVQSSKIELIF